MLQRGRSIRRFPQTSGFTTTIDMVVGPWVGEFGWELFGWQAHMRTKALSGEPMTCITRTGRGVLYSDFAKVEYFDPSGLADRWMLFKSKDKKPKTDFAARPLSEGGLFVKYGIPRGKFEILIHARNRTHRAADNWNGWDELELGASVASIGSKDSSLHIEGTSDMRGISLAELVDYMAGARMIVGPSSGPMHLATLCCCPQVVWTDRRGTIERYEKTWNPFSVKAITALARNPTAKRVMELMEQI